MPLTRFKLSAIADGGIDTDELADGAVTLAKTDNLFENTTFTGDDGIIVPKGTTAERSTSPTVGEVRFNTTLDQLEQYTSDSGWQGISPPPVITSTDVTSIDSTAATQTIVITGTNFDTTATAILVDGNGTTKTPTSSTRNNSTQVTIVYSGGDVLDADVSEPLDVRVTNGSGLAATLEDHIGIDDNPIWSTTSGNVGTVYEDEAISTITLTATDPESGGSITYTITSGSLPTGLSLNSSTGEITGTPNVNDTYNSSGVTHNFSVTATGADSDTTVRSFNIVRKWYDGQTLATAARSAADIYAIDSSFQGSGANGTYYLDPTGNGTYAKQYYCNMEYDGGGWVLVMALKRQTDSTAGAYSCDVTGAVSTIPHSNPYLAGDRQAKEHNDVITALQQQSGSVYHWMFDSFNVNGNPSEPSGYPVSGEWPSDGTNMLSGYSRLTFSIEASRRMQPGQGLNTSTILYGEHVSSRTVHNTGQNSGDTMVNNLTVNGNTANEWDYSGDERIYCLTVGNGLSSNNGIANAIHVYADTCGDGHTGPYTLHMGNYNCYHAWELIFVK